MEGLNTKINDLERKVYIKVKKLTFQIKFKKLIIIIIGLRQNHERRLLELEEKTRSLEGVMEELSYLKEQINKLTQKNADLLEKIENLSQKNPS